MNAKFIIYGLLIGCLVACKTEVQRQFTDVSADSGIEFANILSETDEANIFTYEYFYNGAGVSVGDVNGDGLTDIYFTANQLSNKLYLNKGDLKFEDATEAAGVGGRQGWKTGTIMADVNGDGLLDIYVCYSGAGDATSRSNQLFINKGVKDGRPFFEDEAAAIGLDAPGTNSTQAVFFDYDRDNDLDMFLLNHATMFYSPLVNTYKLRHKRHPYFSNYLFKNDNGHFTDVSSTAGITGGGNNFGLGVVASDINNDGWIDLYMTNDYDEQDFLLLNNRNGTFSDATKASLKHISKFGMGCDVADYNNDGLMDIMVPDMWPADNYRQKVLRGPDDYDRYNILVDSGYFHQNMRNTLQLNAGVNQEGIPQFSEIGQLAGVSNTDWSWSSLLADFDNDGYKDMYISNGFWRDYSNMDFQTYDVAEYKQQYGPGAPLLNLINKIPQTRISNYAFKNNRDLTFQEVTNDWGLNTSNVSHGVAYADFDNDGDLDIAVNNMGERASVYRNNNSTGGNYLRVKLVGLKGNSNAVGSKVTVKTTESGSQCVEQQPERGYLSGVEPVIHFGLGKHNTVEELIVRWPDGRYTHLKEVKANQTIVVNEATAQVETTIENIIKVGLFQDYTEVAGIDYEQQENHYVDYKSEYLLPWQLSKQGPKMAKGDVNGDGLEDVFVGAPAGQTSCLFLQTKVGKFVKSASQAWQSDNLCEDTDCAFFDADSDKDLDLYVVSGGNENNEGKLMQDRLYINDGKGNFIKAISALPVMTTSKSCVAVADYNNDGKPDIFVGGRLVKGQYGAPAKSYLLKNETVGTSVKFTEVPMQSPTSREGAGMVTSAIFTHINADNQPDLLLVGEWMQVKLFINEKGNLVERTTEYGLADTHGLWTSITAGDVDNDGDTDYLLGNLTPNTQFKASVEQPMKLCINDFYKTGRPVAILCYYNDGKSYPYASKNEITEAMPQLAKKFLHYKEYAQASFEEIFPAEQRQGMRELKVTTLKNSWLENTGKGKLVLHELPVEAQFSAIQGAVIKDFDGDGQNEVLAAGNFYPFRVQLGQEDAGKGVLLKWDKKAGKLSKAKQGLGVWIDGDVRDLAEIKSAHGASFIVISKNSGSIQVIQQ